MDLRELDLMPGFHCQQEIWDKFKAPITLLVTCDRENFLLVVSIGQCKFHLSEEVVASLLHASIGEDRGRFEVLPLGDRVFRFTVSRKKVGFYIYGLWSFECREFKIHFHLWGRGGPQVEREQCNWDNEEQEQWMLVQNRRLKSKSYVDVVRQANPPTRTQQINRPKVTSANYVPLGFNYSFRATPPPHKRLISKSMFFYRL